MGFDKPLHICADRKEVDLAGAASDVPPWSINAATKMIKQVGGHSAAD